ncbi:hypothetical protein CANINC_000806 [Pichia inconspicua]|uniref:DNA polymerase V n=1 Tax=Pichia inconspicua TaxID=52247 RepID=A0A4V4NG50_9ASCO|nr:hypothetical protein CANINC_000806 [[Candida] inconspicua]
MPVSKDHYYRLASNLPKERIQAASSLLQELENENSTSDFKYALQRLISGLASNHDSARIGFSMCLTELISLLSNNKDFNYTAEDFLSDLELNLNKQIKDKQKGKNLRAYLFGKIFGVQSLINSNLIKSDDEQLIIQIIDSLFEIALTKSWIREIAIVTIVKLVGKFHLESNKKIMPHILSKLDENHLLLSMDGLLVYLSIPVTEREQMSNLAKLNNHWVNDNPLSKGNIPLLKDSFLDRIVPASNEEEKKEKNSIQKGSWNPQLHYVWAPLLSELFTNEINNKNNEEPKLKKQKSKKFSNNGTSVLILTGFWPTFDTTFFSNSASPERKHSGLQILELCFKLPNFKAAFFPIIFSDNLTRSLINHVSKKDRVLHNLAQKVLSNAVETARAIPNGRVELIKALESHCILFDRLTKTRTVKDLMSNISSDNIKTDLDEWVAITDWVLNSDNELIGRVHKYDINTAKHDVQIFKFDSLLSLIRGNKKLIRNVVSPGNEELSLIFANYASKILEYFATIVYVMSASDIKETDIRIAKDRLQSILSDLMECTKGAVDWSGILLKFLTNCEKSNSLRSSIDSSDELMKTKNEAFKIWNELGVSLKSNEMEDDEMRLSKCLVMLCSTALLELYGGDVDSFGVLDDLINIYNDFKGKSGDSENIMNALVDLLLTYLTQKSGLKKRIGTNIWESIVHDVKLTQLERLFDVLTTRENKAGMEQLFNQVFDDYEEDSEEGESDNEKEEDMEEEKSDDEEEDEEDEEDDDDTNDEDDEEKDSSKAKIEEVEKSTTSALAKALNVNEKDHANESKASKENHHGNNDDDDSDSDSDNDDEDDDDNDDEYESDESMSDEQMMAIDHQLSAIFQQRQNSLQELRASSKNGNERKLEAKDARELMALCKLRVLDLLDLYVTTHSSNSNCATIVIVLLDLMDLTLDIKVGEKAHKIIKKTCKTTFKFNNIEDEIDGTFEMIDSVLNRAAKSKFSAFTHACSQVSVYLIRSIVSADPLKFEDYVKRVSDIYQKHMVTWATNSSDKSSAVIFNDLVNWINSKRANKNSTNQ